MWKNMYLMLKTGEKDKNAFFFAQLYVLYREKMHKTGFIHCKWSFYNCLLNTRRYKERRCG